MMKFQKGVHIVAIGLFLLAIGNLLFTDTVPTVFSAVMYCVAGAIWVANSYLVTFHNKSQ